MRVGSVKRGLKLFALNSVMFLVFVVLAEVLYSSFRFYHSNEKSIWIFEDAGKTVQFDSIRGYTLTTVPSRFARITGGQIEYIGTFRGNAQGFQDRDDFRRERSRPGAKRFAVFGDSYSTGQYIALNWPDRAEDLLRREGVNAELLNFSIYGGGLANWASVLRSIVEAQHYDLDGLIFAVWRFDLDRKFSFADLRDRQHYAFIRARSWDSADHPTHLDDRTKSILKDAEAPSSFILTTDEFNRVLKGQFLNDREWHFALYDAVRSLYWSYLRQRRALRASEPSAKLNESQIHLAEGIREFARSRRIPILVVFIGDRTTTLSRHEGVDVQQTRQFAQLLGAEFLDGRAAFDGMDQSQLNKLWLPQESHWALGGSDVFAYYMARELAGRLKSEGGAGFRPSR